MRILFSLLFAFFSITILQAQDRTLSVKLTEAQGSVKGEASGPTVLQYYGYQLGDLFKVLDGGYAFEIDNKALDNKKFSLDVEGDLSNKGFVIEEINEQLKEVGYEVEVSTRHPKVYHFTFDDLGTCDLSGGEVSSESLFKTTWKAKCVTLDKLMEKLREWQPELIIDNQGQGEIKIPQIKLKKASLKDIQKQLADQGITFAVSDELSLRKYITVYR